jgi:glycosyltransferase involved in cell wall biosynthesis
MLVGSVGPFLLETRMRVALVHDYLTQYGGAERVLEVLHSMYPDATVYTSLYEPGGVPDAFGRWDIRTSALSRVPGANRDHRIWTPLYPFIFRRIGEQKIGDVDLVIADSSAWSHHAQPASHIPMICYCHSPARFLYEDDDYLKAVRYPWPLRMLTEVLFRALRRHDQRAARKVTRFVANSEEVRRRIRETWGQEAVVIHPPIDVDRFRPTTPVQPEDWYLVVSRLVPHKWIDLAVQASTAANVPLKVIGAGRAEGSLRQMAGPTVEFLGELSDDEVVAYMQRCKALILPGVEDFGMTAVEAQAAGRPVIAAGAGGALETVIPGVTGLHFEPHNEAQLAALLKQDHDWDTEAIFANAARFRREVFEEKMRALVDEVVAKR